MWMLDFNACVATLGGAKHQTDYDGLAINPAQVFFPMDGDGAWRGVARSLRAEVDTERMEALGVRRDVCEANLVAKRRYPSLRLLKIEGVRVVAV